QSISSLLEAAKLLSDVDVRSPGSGQLLSSLVRVASSLAPAPLPIPAKPAGLFLSSPSDGTLVTTAPSGTIEVWKVGDPGQARRIGAIDIKSKSFYYAVDPGRRELYTFVLGNDRLSRWSLSDGSLLGEIRSPVLPKDFSGAVDFRPHLGGLVVSDGKVGA